MSLESDIKAMVNSLDLELYDTSIVNENSETIYRISVVSPTFIDGKRESVSLDRCVELTHLISPLLDVTPPVSGEYRLEVGTPGIERKITKEEHYRLSVGELVSLTLIDKEKVRGKLLSFEDQTLSIEDQGETKEISLSDVAKAKTYFEW